MATQTANATAEEDRILRTWTPLILRCNSDRQRDHHGRGNRTLDHVRARLLRRALSSDSARAGCSAQRALAQLFEGMRQVQPHAVMIVGLYVLTLVPLARVAFTLVLFLKERDFIYVALTAYVLAALIIGVMLGRVG